jgi:hypothetical protein
MFRVVVNGRFHYFSNIDEDFIVAMRTRSWSIDIYIWFRRIRKTTEYFGKDGFAWWVPLAFSSLAYMFEFVGLPHWIRVL